MNPGISRGRHPSCSPQSNRRWVYNRGHTSRGGFDSLAAAKANRRRMAGQLPLAIAQLLVERIPPFRAPRDDDAPAMAPVLHAHTDAGLALGDQQDPVLVLRKFSGRVAALGGLALEAVLVLLLALGTDVLEGALEVLGEGDLVRGLLAGLLPAAGGAAGGRDEEVALGHGGAEVERRLEDRALVVRVDVVEAVRERHAAAATAAELRGDEHGVRAAEDAEGHRGRGGGRREVVPIARLARTFRVIRVVKDDDGAFEGL